MQEFIISLMGQFGYFGVFFLIALENVFPPIPSEVILLFVLRLKEKDIDMADHWFDTKGNKTVFFCRFIPIVRSLISIPAGMSEMPMAKFLLYTTVGSAIWNTVLIVIGNRVGENWESILGVFDQYSHIVLILLILIFVLFIVWFYTKKQKKKKA